MAFYSRLLGAEPVMRPNDREACWRLREDAWLYVLEDPGRAGHSVATILVEDLDAWIAAARGRGAELPAPVAVDGGLRKLEVVDPDGNELGVGGP